VQVLGGGPPHVGLGGGGWRSRPDRRFSDVSAGAWRVQLAGRFFSGVRARTGWAGGRWGGVRGVGWGVGGGAGWGGVVGGGGGKVGTGCLRYGRIRPPRPEWRHFWFGQSSARDCSHPVFGGVGYGAWLLGHRVGWGSASKPTGGACKFRRCGWGLVRGRAIAPNVTWGWCRCRGPLAVCVHLGAGRLEADG